MPMVKRALFLPATHQKMVKVYIYLISLLHPIQIALFRSSDLWRFGALDIPVEIRAGLSRTIHIPLHLRSNPVCRHDIVSR